MAALAPEIQKRVEEWLKPPFDAETVAELQALVDAGDEQELHERFYQGLEFGTGGLRGIMGAGLNRMNRYTVGRATQGLANYMIRELGADAKKSVVIARDSRINSEEFVREVASVLAGNGIKTYVFDDLRPTPELSFAVRMLGASAGIVVTASHNPKEYNGYKVYWGDGGQVVPPHDTGIIAEVQAIEDFNAINRVDYDKAVADGQIVVVGEKVDNAYYEAILPLSLKPAIVRDFGAKLKVVYTPLHGAGISLAPEAMKRWGFSAVEVCESQRVPDGNFPTTVSPNPEERAALSEAIKQAEASGADLVLATDPDADRVGIAVRHNGEFVLITGNQIAALLVEYVLGTKSEFGMLLPNAAVVKTIVTTELIAAITARHGVRLDNVLTGFKYIGEKIRKYQESGEAEYLVGGEESYGYLVGTHARDKDAIVCCCMIAEMAADSMAKGETLVDRLDDVLRGYGVFQEDMLSLKLAGSQGQQQIGRIMTVFRDAPPTEVAGVELVELRDYLEDEIREVKTGDILGKTNLPCSNVLVFRFADGSQIVGRPSGTEPKIKFYFSVCDCEALPIAIEDLPARKEQVAMRLATLRDAFMVRVDEIINN